MTDTQLVVGSAMAGFLIGWAAIRIWHGGRR